MRWSIYPQQSIIYDWIKFLNCIFIFVLKLWTQYDQYIIILFWLINPVPLWNQLLLTFDPTLLTYNPQMFFDVADERVVCCSQSNPNFHVNSHIGPRFSTACDARRCLVGYKSAVHAQTVIGLCLLFSLHIFLFKVKTRLAAKPQVNAI